MHYVNKYKKVIAEGELRCPELSKYLDEMDRPRHVFLAEDGSGIVTKVSYDPTSNQMVGLVLPMDTQTGIPIKFTYKPKSINDIEEFLKKPKSSHIYIVMAQPIKPNTPPFILQLFGTDNKFSALNVTQRWEYTINELKKLATIICNDKYFKLNTKILIQCFTQAQHQCSWNFNRW